LLKKEEVTGGYRRMRPQKLRQEKHENLAKDLVEFTNFTVSSKSKPHTPGRRGKGAGRKGSLSLLTNMKFYRNQRPANNRFKARKEEESIKLE